MLRSKIGVFIDLFRKTTALAEMNRAMEAEMIERQQAEERFRMVVETAPNAMVMIAADGQILLVNSRTESLFGYDRDELICQQISVLIAEDALHDFEPARVPRELVGKRKNGTTVPIELGLSQFRSADGVFKLASFVDITSASAPKPPAGRKRGTGSQECGIAPPGRGSRAADAGGGRQSRSRRGARAFGLPGGGEQCARLIVRLLRNVHRSRPAAHPEFRGLLHCRPGAG